MVIWYSKIDILDSIIFGHYCYNSISAFRSLSKPDNALRNKSFTLFEKKYCITHPRIAHSTETG